MPATNPLLRWIRNSIADRGLSLRENLARAPLQTLCRELVFEKGEASGTAIAREIAERYGALSPGERLEFFESLLEAHWLADPEEVLRSAKAYHVRPTAGELSKLFSIVEPKRQELFRRINMGPDGTETVVSMRRDLLSLLPGHPRLEPINSDLMHLLASWFNRGFLELRRIDWKTPANVLEKLIEYEAVHEIRGWSDLKRRLQNDRRCFAFFHPALPDDPLIFVQVALTRGMPAAIQPLLDTEAAEADLDKVDTAAFYSISNCLDGLRNISFGAFLLKQVIVELENENLGVKNFVTLSPAPGFRGWLNSNSPALATVNPGSTTKDHRQALTRECAVYLTSAQPSGRVVDSVAHFHLSNGASIERINWMADTSQKGMHQSLGVMVNYSYRPARIEKNHEQYVKHSRVAVSNEINALLDEKQPRAELLPAGAPSPGSAVEAAKARRVG